MFSSNVGFRRRTVSEGLNQLQQPSSSGKHASGAPYRYSLDESQSTTIKRVVLRKRSDESSGSRLADRLARSEVENIGGFWSRRLSGQKKRSVPPSPRQTESGATEWSTDAETSTSNADKGQARSKPCGPRPLPSQLGTSPNRMSYRLSDALISSASPSSELSSRTPPGSPFLSLDFLQDPAPSQPTDPASQSLTESKNDNDVSPSARDPASGTVVEYRPLLPPGLPAPLKSSMKPPRKPKREDKPVVKAKDKNKDKKRFAHIELTINKLISGSMGNKKYSDSKPLQIPMITVVKEKHSTALIPHSSSSIPSSLIPLPPIPPMPPMPPVPPIPASAVAALPPIYRSRAQAVEICRQSIKSIRRKSTRKRKTGLARIVVELAKGGQVKAVDAEKIQEAAEVRDILAQLRRMKAA